MAPGLGIESTVNATRQMSDCVLKSFFVGTRCPRDVPLAIALANSPRRDGKAVAKD